jgi:hypothetical protein
LPFRAHADTQVEDAAAAIAHSALLVLSHLFPDAGAELKQIYDATTEDIPPTATGLTWGRLVADTLLSDRSNDGSSAGEPFTPAPPGPFYPFEHQPDPSLPDRQPFHAPHWGKVKAFGFNDLSASVTPLPDPLGDKEAYIASFNEVKEYGGVRSSVRTAEELVIGKWWAYDGALDIGLPPRLFFQCVDAIVDTLGDDERVATGYNLVKLYALVAVAMADGAIQAWEEKYKWNFWRPAIGIRDAELDGFCATEEDDSWVAVGSPFTNTDKPSFTPAFPAYPSGHAVIGSAAFETVRKVLDLPADFTFEAVSDEYNGESTDMGVVRPLEIKTLTIDDAIEQNKISRVYLGVHWRIDSESGATLGAEIAEKLVSAFPAKV